MISIIFLIYAFALPLHINALICNAKSGSQVVSVVRGVDGNWCGIDGEYNHAGLLATAYWKDSIEEIGWGQLRVKTSKVYSIFYICAVWMYYNDFMIGNQE